ncbi:MAG: iron-containing alcohol dehydrogenase [Clostridia bacterium]|jgi:alcohol dehydrogenase class IV|nr:iron-containing alcohol dehydrogenase [Clostridia bacterium]
MNIFKRGYCRVFQKGLYMALPFLPYREPKILKSNQEVVEVLKSNGVSSLLIVTDKGIRGLGLTEQLEQLFKSEGLKFVVYDETVANPTTQNVEEALMLYKENECQAIIAFGGGSAMDAAKATGARIARPNKTLAKMKGILKVRKKLPLLIAVPTTAGTGSETTLAAVITDSQTRHKYAINDFPLIPRYALLLPQLTIGLPPMLTATTGMDALTHAVEAFIGNSTTKKTRKEAIWAVDIIFKFLPIAYSEPQNIEARTKMLEAAYHAGVAFTKSYVGYVHAVAHSLGGKYNIPHGLANAILLPVVLKKYGRKVFKKLWILGVKAGLFDKTISKEEGAKLFIEKIEDLNKSMNIGKVIGEIKEEDIPALAVTAEHEANPLYPVPVLFTAKQLEEIYREVKNG